MAKARTGKHVPTAGLDIPECPVCLDTMTSPIFQCQSGHSLCHVCTQQLVPSICPLCKQVMTQMRNWQLEELVDKAKRECTNKSLGCTYLVKTSELEDHLKECIFRDYNCPHGETFGACSWSGKIKDLMSHFKSNHPENCRIVLDKEANIMINSNGDNRLMYLLSQGKYLFIFTIRVDSYQKVIYYVIQHIGTRKNAHNYIYEINVISTKDSQRRATFIDHCFGDSYDIKEIFNAGTCGIMPTKMLTHFAENNMIKLNISITRNENAVKNIPKDNKKEAKNQNEGRKMRTQSPAPRKPHMGPKASVKPKTQK